MSLNVPRIVSAFAVRKRGRVTNDQIKFHVGGQGAHVVSSVTAGEAILLVVGEVVDFEVAFRPFNVGIRPIDGRDLLGVSIGGVDGKRTGVREKIEHTFAVAHVADHGAGVAVVEEQARIGVVRQIDEEFQIAFVDDYFLQRVVDLLVLLVTTLPHA